MSGAPKRASRAYWQSPGLHLTPYTPPLQNASESKTPYEPATQYIIDASRPIPRYFQTPFTNAKAAAQAFRESFLTDLEEVVARLLANAQTQEERNEINTWAEEAVNNYDDDEGGNNEEDDGDGYMDASSGGEDQVASEPVLNPAFVDPLPYDSLPPVNTTTRQRVPPPPPITPATAAYEALMPQYTRRGNLLYGIPDDEDEVSVPMEQRGNLLLNIPETNESDETPRLEAGPSRPTPAPAIQGLGARSPRLKTIGRGTGRRATYSPLPASEGGDYPDPPDTLRAPLPDSTYGAAAEGRVPPPRGNAEGRVSPTLARYWEQGGASTSQAIVPIDPNAPATRARRRRGERQSYSTDALLNAALNRGFRVPPELLNFPQRSLPVPVRISNPSQYQLLPYSGRRMTPSIEQAVRRTEQAAMVRPSLVREARPVMAEIRERQRENARAQRSIEDRYSGGAIVAHSDVGRRKEPRRQR